MKVSPVDELSYDIATLTMGISWRMVRVRWKNLKLQ
jgi:hypothetical protein